MIFQEPRSGVLSKEEAEMDVFQDLADRWVLRTLFNVLLNLISFCETLCLSSQNGALGRTLLGKEEGAASCAFPEKSPPGFVSMATNAALKVTMCLILYNTKTACKQEQSVANIITKVSDFLQIWQGYRLMQQRDMRDVHCKRHLGLSGVHVYKALFSQSSFSRAMCLRDFLSSLKLNCCQLYLHTNYQLVHPFFTDYQIS